MTSFGKSQTSCVAICRQATSCISPLALSSTSIVEKIEKHANDALVDDDVTFKELWSMEKDTDIEELQESVKTECIENIGYFIEPNFLFSSVIESIKKKENILPILERSLKRIEDSTLGQDSEEDFGGLFSDIDLASPKLGKTADDKNTLVSNVLLALDDIDFWRRGFTRD